MHQNDSCPKRIIECAHCQDEYTFIEKQASIPLGILKISSINNCLFKILNSIWREYIVSTKCKKNRKQSILGIHWYRVQKMFKLTDDLFLLQRHEEVYCRRFPLTCPNSCGKKEIPREEVNGLWPDCCTIYKLLRRCTLDKTEDKELKLFCIKKFRVCGVSK